jgi:peptidoglycan/LPS O-acetylase OafA/YrhL
MRTGGSIRLSHFHRADAKGLEGSVAGSGLDWKKWNGLTTRRRKISSIREPRRIAELDGVRGVAITSVIIAHAFGTPLLWAGVDLFFVLSGLLITGILIRRKESGGSYFAYFYERRARRIVMPYVLLLIVSSLLFGTAWIKYWYWFAFFATNIGAALHQVGHDSLAPLWSLAVEEQFYLVWPLIVIAVRRNTLLGISVAIVIAAPILRAVATPWFDTHFPIYYLTPFRMDLLASGATLAWIQRWNPTLMSRLSHWPQMMLVGVGGLLLVLAVMDPGFRTGANTIRGNVLIYSATNIIATSFVIIALIGRGAICGFLRNPILGFVGRVSYSMYLIHQVALILAAQVFPGKLLASFGLALVLTILYASGSWYGIERWLLAARSNATDEKSTPILP